MLLIPLGSVPRERGGVVVPEISGFVRSPRLSSTMYIYPPNPFKKKGIPVAKNLFEINRYPLLNNFRNQSLFHQIFAPSCLPLHPNTLFTMAEPRPSSGSTANPSEQVPQPTAPDLEDITLNENAEESYPPTRQVVPILLALATAIFLVSLVSSTFHSYQKTSF
jgi:hypothetical protein